MNQAELTKRAVDFVKEGYHKFFSGLNDIWFANLTKDTSYIGTGEPTLFGRDAIQAHFSSFSTIKYEILQEEYFPVVLGPDTCLVFGKDAVSSFRNQYRIVISFSIVVRFEGNEIKLIHQNNSYEYFHMNDTDHAPVKANLLTTQYVRDLLLEQPFHHRLPFRSGTQTIYVNPYTILYVESMGKKTNIVCLDRIIASNYSMSECRDILPDSFYQVHRSYLVNTRYVSSIKRFEVLLLSGLSIPIPEKEYTRVKADLTKMIHTM